MNPPAAVALQVIGAACSAGATASIAAGQDTCAAGLAVGAFLGFAMAEVVRQARRSPAVELASAQVVEPVGAVA